MKDRNSFEQSNPDLRKTPLSFKPSNPDFKKAPLSS